MSGDKKWTRRAAVGFIGTGAGLFAVETAGFTRVDGVRNVGLGAIEDPDALVGFTPGDAHGPVSGGPGERVDLFKVTNNLEDETGSDAEMVVNTVEITGTDGSITPGDVTNIKLPDPIQEGKSGIVSGELSSNDGTAGAVDFKIGVSQDDVSATLDRSVLIEIERVTRRAIEYRGDAIAKRPPEKVRGKDDRKGGEDLKAGVKMTFDGFGDEVTIKKVIVESPNNDIYKIRASGSRVKSTVGGWRKDHPINFVRNEDFDNMFGGEGPNKKNRIKLGDTYTLDDPLQLGEGDDAELYMYRFQGDDDDAVDMRNEELTITFEIHNGAEFTFDIEIPGDPKLSITNVSGLEDELSGHGYEADITVEESEDEPARNTTVTLHILEAGDGIVYNGDATAETVDGGKGDNDPDAVTLTVTNFGDEAETLTGFNVDVLDDDINNLRSSGSRRPDDTDKDEPFGHPFVIIDAGADSGVGSKKDRFALGTDQEFSRGGDDFTIEPGETAEIYMYRFQESKGDEKPRDMSGREMDLELKNDQGERTSFGFTINDTAESAVYDRTIALGTLKGASNAAKFDDIGTLSQGDYRFAVIADADNADLVTERGEFTVGGDEEGTMAERADIVSAETVNDDSSIVDFTVETSGTEDVVIMGLGIDYPEGGEGDAKLVATSGGQNKKEIEFTNGGFFNAGGGNRGIDFGSSPIDFKKDGKDGKYETIPGADTTTGTLTEFKDLNQGGNPHKPVNVGNSTLNITLVFQDGTEETYTVTVS